VSDTGSLGLLFVDFLYTILFYGIKYKTSTLCIILIEIANGFP